MTALMQLEDARALAKEVVQLLSPHCERIEIAGSIRRGKTSAIKDLEIIAQPKFFEGAQSLFEPVQCNELEAAVKEFVNNGILKKGLPRGKDGTISAPFSDRYYALRYRDCPLDLFVCLPPAEFGLLHLIRTGCADFSQCFVTRLWRWNLRSVNGHIERLGCGICPTPEEKDAFYLNDLKFLPPEERSIFSGESLEDAKRRWGFS